MKATVFLTDMADYAEFNQMYVDMLGDHRPARSLVAVAGLPLGALVESRGVGLRGRVARRRWAPPYGAQVPWPKR